MDNNEEEKVLNKTILNPGVAKPISITKEEALLLASSNKKEQKVSTSETNIAKSIPVTEKSIDESKVNEVNDLMKNDYVKIVEIHHSKKTYIILFLVLAGLIALIIFELIFYGGKLS